ncbi:hypothetical protein [Streptomyces graminofaciens]|uniref:hypothetical protein n=1 Tax=Streptomyces graminofaciens TaxID=68212 RepID=UPI002573162A|nr:hypothetical protein [Streptomyces graminofaciens]
MGTETPADSAMNAIVTGRDVSPCPSFLSTGPSAALSAKVVFPIVEPPSPGAGLARMPVEQRRMDVPGSFWHLLPPHLWPRAHLHVNFSAAKRESFFL